MLDFLEFEEMVGRAWHRALGEAVSYPRHPEAAVSLDEVRGPLAVFFRGLGGEFGVQLAATTARTSGHRLSLGQRLRGWDERMARPGRDGGTVFLPPVLDLLPERRLNRDLYTWLAAFFAHLPPRDARPSDPLQRDLAMLDEAQAATARVLTAAPGLRRMHAELCAAVLAARPKRRLPEVERMVEARVVGMLSSPSPLAGEALLSSPSPLAGEGWGGGDARHENPTIRFAEASPPPNPPPRGGRASAGYKPFLPVPLWGEALEPPPSRRDEEDERGGNSADAEDGRKRKAKRRATDQAQREDSLILNRFEKILGLAEMIDLNRDVDDDEEEDARKAADDLDEISTGQHKRKPATKLKFDLDLPPEAIDPATIQADLTYPEWDYKKAAYRPDFCRVLAGTAAEEGEAWQPDAETEARIRRVRRQFEALRPRHQTLRAQVDGNELDVEALVRARCDLKASGLGSDRIHLATRRQARDLAVALLVDVSLSTDAYVDNRRVLDVEKQALTILANGIAACGDDSAIFTFTSRKRHWVRIETVKDFAEPMGERIARRIAALRPGFYTRIGPAVRHAAAKLIERPHRHRLLLVLTDGKPNDVDHYEGRYGIEDTRKAIQEARRAGVAVFGVTVDREAKSYFPTLFGRGGYAIVPNVARLPVALPAIYRQLVVS